VATFSRRLSLSLPTVPFVSAISLAVTSVRPFVSSLTCLLSVDASCFASSPFSLSIFRFGAPHVRGFVTPRLEYSITLNSNNRRIESILSSANSKHVLRFPTLASLMKKQRSLQFVEHSLRALDSWIHLRVREQGGLIVSDMARNRRGRRKHVINTCSRRAHARANAAAAAQFSDHTRLLPPCGVARIAPMCACIYIYIYIYIYMFIACVHASAAASNRCSANAGITFARTKRTTTVVPSFRARAAVRS